MPMRQLFSWAVAIISACYVGCGAQPLAAPTEFHESKPKQGIFHLKYPACWKYDSGEFRGDEWAEFTESLWSQRPKRGGRSQCCSARDLLAGNFGKMAS